MSMVKGLKEEKSEVTAQDGGARMRVGGWGSELALRARAPRHSLVLAPPASMKPSPVAPAHTDLCPLIMEHLLFDE